MTRPNIDSSLTLVPLFARRGRAKVRNDKYFSAEEREVQFGTREHKKPTFELGKKCFNRNRERGRTDIQARSRNAGREEKRPSLL